jgi:hypothetical protein
MNMIQHDGVLGTKPPTAPSHPGGSGKYEFEVKIRSAVEGNPAVVWQTSSSKPASSLVARNNATKDVVAHYKDAMVQSESLARGGVMTMTLCDDLDAALLVCLCFVWVARLAVVVCPM